MENRSQTYLFQHVNVSHVLPPGEFIRVRGSPERDILSLRTLGLGLDRFGASFRRRFSKVGKPTKEAVECGPTWGTCL